MKHKLLYLFFALLILCTSTGFGFLESSTATHKKAHHVKTDSLSVNMVNLSVNNSSLPHREAQKTADETITKSIIQWVADAVKNTVERVVTYMMKVLESIVIDLINFFTK